MTSKVFSLVAQKLSNPDFKAYKKLVNATLERFTGRKLNPSNLNECASLLLGAENSNVMAAQFKAKSVEEIIANYFGTLKLSTEDTHTLSYLNHNQIELIRFELNGEMISIFVDVLYDVPKHYEDDDLVWLRLWTNAHNHESNSVIANTFSQGGKYLLDVVSQYRDDGILGQFYEELISGDGGRYDLEKTQVVDLIVNRFGYTDYKFGRDPRVAFSAFDEIENFALACLQTIAVDLNLSFAAHGKARMVGGMPTFYGRFEQFLMK